MTIKDKTTEVKRATESELSKVVTPAVLEEAYIHFIEQADDNAKSGRARGSQKPYGFSKNQCVIKPNLAQDMGKAHQVLRHI